MNKIVVVSMVKNEADVIESFVRHALTFADVVLVADHQSTDGTGKILQALQEEGLPLYVKPYYQVELAHAEVMNSLLHEAIEKYGADIVLPADADEFLLNTKTPLSCRTILQTLDRNRVYKLHWWKVEPKEPEQGMDQFILYRPCRRSRAFAPAQKILVGAGIAIQRINDNGHFWQLRMVQGCHYAYWQSEDGEKRADDEAFLDTLQVAHFHWRSDVQYASKIAVSWINNVAKYSENTIVADYLKVCFDKLSRRQSFRPEDFLDGAEDVDFRPYCVDQPLRYAAQGRPDVLRNLMLAAEALAEAYAEEKVLRHQKRVSVMVPFAGNCNVLEQMLDNLAEQTYPDIEVIVLSGGTAELYPLAVPVLEKYQDTFVRIQYAVADRPESIETAATGDYIQWMLPGIQLRPYKIWRMLACMEAFDYQELGAVFSCGGDSAFTTYLEFPADKNFMAFAGGQRIWQFMLSQAKSIPGGISAAFFSRKAMADCRWFQACWIGGRFIEIGAWELVLLLPERAIGVLRESMLAFTDDVSRLEHAYWHQLTLAIFLEQYRGNTDMLPDYDKARRCLYEAGRRLEDEGSQQLIDQELWVQHQALLDRLLAE